MKLGDLKDLAMLAGMGVIAYFVYKQLKKIPSVDDVKRAANEAANVLLPGNRVSVTGQVHLPSGQYISFDDIVRGGSMVDTNNSFVWQGVSYTLIGRGPDGNYEVM